MSNRKPGFAKGVPRHPNAGRKKGTPNKATADFKEILLTHNFSPGQKMIECFQAAWNLYETRREHKAFGPAVDALKLSAKIADDISQYTYPRLKAIEHSGEIALRTFADFIRAGTKNVNQLTEPGDGEVEE